MEWYDFKQGKGLWFDVRPRILILLLVGAVLAVGSWLVFPPLANAVCRNMLAERMSRWLVAGTSLTLPLQDTLCATAAPDMELGVMDALVKGDAGQARATVERFLTAYPHTSRSRFWAARLIQVAQTPIPAGAAGTAFDLAVEIEPNDSLFWYQRGDFYLMQKEADKAADSYRSGIAVGAGTAADGYMRLGVMFSQLQKPEQALEAFQQAAQSEDTNAQLPKWQKALLYFYVGGIYAQEKQWDESVVYYQRSLDTSQAPGWPTYAAYLGLGDAAFAQGEAVKAGSLYGKALEWAKADPDRAVVYKELGQWHNVTGDTEQALRDYEQATRFNPNDEWSYLAAAQLQEQMGQIPQAIVNYRKALSIHPNLAAAQEALRRLEK